MTDHPHEGAQWRFARIDQADAPEIEMNGAGQVARGELLRGPNVEQQGRLRRLQLTMEFLRGGEHCYWITTKRQRRATSLASTYFPISFSNCSFVFQGRYSLNSRCMRRPAPGMLMMSSSVAVLRFTGMKTYFFKRSVSGWPTYLLISLSNCAQFFHGRYSGNSRAIRLPARGMSRISSRVPVFRFT